MDKVVMANHLDIEVEDKPRKTAVVVYVVIPSDSNIREKGRLEARKVPRAERRAQGDVDGEGNSDPSGNRSTQCKRGIYKHTYIEPMILSHEVLETSLPVMIPSKHTGGYITAAHLDWMVVCCGLDDSF